MSSNPLRFHQCHSRNIQLTHDGTSAHRLNTEFFTKALLFSSRPIQPNEEISFKISQLGTNPLGGFLYVGLTTRDPSKLPICAYGSLTNKPGYWSWFFPQDPPITTSTTIHYHFAPNGKVYYGRDRKHIGTFPGVIRTDQPIWALFDLFGNSKTITLVKELTIGLNLEYQSKMLHFEEVPLHSTLGKKMCPLGSGRVFRRDARYDQGYCFTRLPIRINERVVVKVLAHNGYQSCGLNIGLTSCDPEYLHWYHLPDNCNTLLDRSEYWVVMGSTTNASFSPGDELSFMVSPSGRVRLVLNGTKVLGEVFVDQKLVLWGWINLFGGSQAIQVMSAVVEETSPVGEDEEKECMVCYDNNIDSVLFGCGHKCMCFDCALQQWQGKGHGHCPLCRALIEDVIQIHKRE